MLCINQFKDIPVEIPVNIHSQLSKTITLDAFDIRGFENGASIILEDRQTGAEIDLKNQSTYMFTGEAGENENRFYLRILSTVQVPDAIDINNNVNVYCNNQKLYISDPLQRSGTLVINSVLGQPLYTQEISGNDQTIDISLFRGILFVEIYYDDFRAVEKLINL